MLTKLGPAVLLTVVIQTLAACRSGGSDSVVISEFLAANASGLTDSDGDTSDWIELHNWGNVAVDLEGWCLTDDRHECRWRFPALQIPAHAYLLVFASGKSLGSASEQLHTNFRLKASTHHLALLRPGGGIAHQFAPYPDQKVDVSFGLTSAGVVDYLSRPTPGAPNGEGRASPAAGEGVGAASQRKEP